MHTFFSKTGSVLPYNAIEILTPHYLGTYSRPSVARTLMACSNSFLSPLENYPIAANLG